MGNAHTHRQRCVHTHVEMPPHRGAHTRTPPEENAHTHITNRCTHTDTKGESSSHKSSAKIDFKPTHTWEMHTEI